MPDFVTFFRFIGAASALALDATRKTLRFEIDIQGAPASTVSGRFSRGLPFSDERSAALVRATGVGAPLKERKPLPNSH